MGHDAAHHRHAGYRTVRAVAFIVVAAGVNGAGAIILDTRGSQCYRYPTRQQTKQSD
jgi:hypothetical protein